MSKKKKSVVGRWKVNVWVFEGEQFLRLPDERFEESRPQIDEAEKLKKVCIMVKEI